MTNALFLRLLPYEDKSSKLSQAIEQITLGRVLNPILHVVNPSSFSQVPNSPFSYWVSEHVRRLFTALPLFKEGERTVKQGLATADDFRFVHAWWEVSPYTVVRGVQETSLEEFHKQTYLGKRWIPFSKGGAFSPYHIDLHLVVNWEHDGEEIKTRINPETGQPYSNVWQLKGTEHSFFFRRGLTWPLRTNGLSFRLLPSGCIFGHKGPAAFVAQDSQSDLLTLVAVMNSQSFDLLVKMLVARVSLAQSFEVGLIQSVPIPNFLSTNKELLAGLARACVDLKRRVDTSNECSHNFHLPGLLKVKGNTLSERILAWQKWLNEVQQQLTKNQGKIEGITLQLYGLQDTDLEAFEEDVKSSALEVSDTDQEALEEDREDISKPVSAQELVALLISYLKGCSVGRWDIRFATGECDASEVSDPFAPLPVCSPGMLMGDDGLPATQDRIVSEEWLCMRPDAITLPPKDMVQQPTIQETQYPITVAWDGILVDDMDHAADIVRRVREVLTVLWPSEDGAKAEAIEREASEILGVKDLHEYFRRQGGFFAHHLKRYSQSRRQAPIYWPLSTASGSYTLWIYYHRLTSDTLFTATNQYVEPKITEIQRKIGELEGRLIGTTGREATRLREEAESARALLAELQDFRAELLRVAALPYRPDLNDSVIINAAPLHRLFRLPKWAKDTKACWEKLQRGEYDWAHLAYTIWPDRVREKCRADRSIAIAHDLEHLYLEQPTMAQRKRS